MQSKIEIKIDKEKYELVKKIKFDETVKDSFVISKNKIIINNPDMFFDFLDRYIYINCLDPKEDYRCNKLGIELYKLYDYLVYN